MADPESFKPELISVTPRALRFAADGNRVQIQMDNISQQRIAWRVRTTAPRHYIVKPNSGFLDPGARQTVTVELQSQRANERHRFVAEALPVSDVEQDRKGVWKTESQQAHRIKLTVDPTPATPVQAQPVPSPKTAKDDHRNKRTIKDLEGKLSTVRNENERLRNRERLLQAKANEQLEEIRVINAENQQLIESRKRLEALRARQNPAAPEPEKGIDGRVLGSVLCLLIVLGLIWILKTTLFPYKHVCPPCPEPKCPPSVTAPTSHASFNQPNLCSIIIHSLITKLIYTKLCH